MLPQACCKVQRTAIQIHASHGRFQEALAVFGTAAIKKIIALAMLAWDYFFYCNAVVAI